MEKFLITGFSGFVSEHFLDLLESMGKNISVMGLDVHAPSFSLAKYKNVRVHYERMDLLDKAGLENVICMFRPDYCLHLASYSSVAFSWKNPVSSFANNTNIFLNLLEAFRLNSIPCRILSIGSSEEYGDVDRSQLPLREDSALNPKSPYAVARVSQELLSTVYVQGFGMDVILTRSFNHIGPGQKDVFVIPSFAKQLASSVLEGKSVVPLTTGDTSVIRDFVDVRDVVRAYYMLFQKGKSGTVYNICSGRGRSLDEVIGLMASQLSVQVEITKDPSLIRPMDNREIVGSHERITSDTGWMPEIEMDKSIIDILGYWKETLQDNMRT